MSISSTVAELARALAAHARDPQHLEHANWLAEMPSYVAQARLDLWEVRVKSLRGLADRSHEDAAAAAIAELGMINMYGEIDPELTAQYFEAALTALAKAGVNVSATGHDLSDW